MPNDACLAQFADLRGGVDLDQFCASRMVGNAATLLPETPDGDPDLYIPDRWANDPPGFATLVANLARFGTSEDEVPRKTGTPWPVDAGPPCVAEGIDVHEWLRKQPPGEPIE